MVNANRAMWAIVTVVSIVSVLVFGKVYVDRRAHAAEAAAVAEVVVAEAPVEVAPDVAIETVNAETAFQTVERDFIASFKEAFKASFFEKVHRIPSDGLTDAIAAASFKEVISYHFGKGKAETLSATSPEWAKMAVMPLDLQLALKAEAALITMKFAKENKAFAN